MLDNSYMKGYADCLLETEKSFNSFLEELKHHRIKPTPKRIHEWIKVQIEWIGVLRNEPDSWIRLYYDQRNFLEWQLVKNSNNNELIIIDKKFCEFLDINNCK